MDERIDNLLNEELARQLEALQDCDPGSEEARKIVDDFVQLQKQALEKQKLIDDANNKEADRQQAQAKAEKDEAAKLEERKAEKRQTIIQAAIQGVGVAITGIGTFLTIAYTNKHFGEVMEFEKTGTISSSVGRGLLGTLFKRK